MAPGFYDDGRLLGAAVMSLCDSPQVRSLEEAVVRKSVHWKKRGRSLFGFDEEDPRAPPGQERS